MNNDIFSLIDAAKEQMKQIGLADATIETYQQRSFNQIIQRYQKEGDYQYLKRLCTNYLWMPSNSSLMGDIQEIQKLETSWNQSTPGVL